MNAGEDLEALSREELIGRARALETLLRIDRAITNARGVGDLAERIVEAVAAYTRFAAVVLLRYAPAREEFDLVAQRGFDESKFPPTKALSLRGSLTGLAAQRRQCLATEDIESDERVDPDTRAALTRNQYASGACVPIFDAEELLGSLNVIYPKGSRLDPSERHILESLGGLVGVSLAARISAERERELEVQARRAQQLESLGVLAGGIAHDFNNLLTGIVGNMDLARLAAADLGGASVIELLDEAHRAARRAATLVAQLLTFSRGGAPVRRLVRDLETLVQDVATFASRGSSVRCDLRIEGPLGPVELDAGQVGQVIQNLVLNACQSSPSGATVTVRAWRERRDGAPRIVIQVIDSGAGIAPEHLPRIFEPFFTAREGGTGLGLAVSHSIVQRHGGTLRAESELGGGSTFTVELPARDEPAAEVIETRPVGPRFHGRALVMDDDRDIREVAGALLGRLGFEVTAAPDGASALEFATRAAAEGKPFRVALLDLTVVGGLGGEEIRADLRRALPEIRLVLSTGYARDGLREGWDASLAKPYSSDQLAEALARALA